MLAIAGRLWWRRKRDGSARNRANGFFLVDVLAACSVVLILIVPMLRLSQQTLAVYREAALLQQRAMLGRELMEQQRGRGETAQLQQVYERQGKTYAASVRAYAVSEAYLCYVVEVTDETGRTFRCKRLERRP